VPARARGRATQIVLCRHLKHEVCAIPKSVKAHRIAEKLDVLEFTVIKPDTFGTRRAAERGAWESPSVEGPSHAGPVVS